jgi:hypothetical protein
MLGISQAHRILKLPGIFPVSIPDVLQSLFDRHIFASWIGSEVCLIEQREQLGGIAWVWNSVVIRPRANICSLGSSESIRPSLHDPSVHRQTHTRYRAGIPKRRHLLDWHQTGWDSWKLPVPFFSATASMCWMRSSLICMCSRLYQNVSCYLQDMLIRHRHINPP